MGYVDSCRNITLTKEGTRLWLSAECRKRNGQYRTSRIDLNLCIGPSSDDDGLMALNGWKAVTLTEGGGEGNGNDMRGWQLGDDGRKFWVEKEVRQGLEGILPWNWYADKKWAWHEFPLDAHLNNLDGTLEFWAEKYKPMFSQELLDALDFIGKVADDIEDMDKPPLQQALDRAADAMLDQKLKSLGWEKKERDWMKGVGTKDWRIVRFGS